jgi:carbonic anhydrase/acetyltransferase-like protein (isoleucine patch superfamily)
MRNLRYAKPTVFNHYLKSKLFTYLCLFSFSPNCYLILPLLFSVIGETATIGNDVSILHGVTLGGTGKELGDRHPKVEHGVVLKDCATILGNIKVGTGSLIMAKSIVTKPVPPLSIMRGVPAKVIATRTLTEDAFDSDLEEHLAFKYLDEWKNL